MRASTQDFRRHGAGLVLLALFALSQAYAVAHHSLVDHVVCPAHGELAHGDHEHAATADAAVVHGGASCSLDANQPSDEHGEHCSVPMPSTQRKGLPPGTSPWRTAPGVSGDVRPLTSQSFDASTPVFRLAPKQSPPRFA